MPRIYHVITDKNVGGGGRVLSSLLSHAKSRFFSYRVLLPKGSDLAPYLRNRGISVIELNGVKDTSFSFSSFLSFYRYLRENPCDILVSHASLSARAAGRALGVPLLLAVKHCAMGGFHFPRLYRALTHHTLAVSENARTHLLSLGVPKEEISVIENGAPPISPPSEDKRRRARELFGIPKGDIAVGLSGRLARVKGHETAIYALKEALAHLPSLSLWFLGEGEEKERLSSLSASLGIGEKVHFLGFAEDTLPFYHAIDAHISCSFGSETASLSLAEGMCAGCPTLASDIEGNRARVGKGGVLFPVGDSHALASLFLSLGEKERREQYRAIALSRAKELPTEKESAEGVEALILSLYKKRLHF